MVFIHSLNQLPNVNLPERLKSFLKKQINAPLSKEDQADLKVSLIFFDDEPNADTSVTDRTCLEHAIRYPEFVLEAPDNHCLSLTITDDAGSGVYLLFPKDCPYPGLSALADQAESSD